MSVKEILTSVNLVGGTDAITFEAFIIRKLVPKLWKAGCVVMDNCPIHLGEEVKKAIEKTGAKLIYLSPYSPNFSPSENLWSKLKIILRSIKTTNYQELGKAIAFAFGQVTSSNIFNWFTHCCYLPHLFEKGYRCTTVSQWSHRIIVRWRQHPIPPCFAHQKPDCRQLTPIHHNTYPKGKCETSSVLVKINKKLRKFPRLSLTFTLILWYINK